MCYFDDIPPEPRTMKELYVLLLSEMVTGKPANIKKFYTQEIFDAKRYLVEKKYLEGIVTGEEIIYLDMDYLKMVDLGLMFREIICALICARFLNHTLI